MISPGRHAVELEPPGTTWGHPPPSAGRENVPSPEPPPEQDNMPSHNDKPTARRIRERLPTLTALETRVISAIAGQMQENTLLKVVAAESGVSEAMVIKVAKKLGFDGFRSLRAALVERNRLPLDKVREELTGQPSAGALAKRVCRASVQALQSTFAALSAEGLERAARWLCAARQRDFYGVGGSAQVARDAAFLADYMEARRGAPPPEPSRLLNELALGS